MGGERVSRERGREGVRTEWREGRKGRGWGGGGGLK